MVKKCVVEYDELGNPIKLIDLKEFSDVKSFKDFGELCQKNKVRFIQRQAEEAHKAEEEKRKLYEKIEQLENENKRLDEILKDAMYGIAYLLGIADFKDINEVFESYINPSPKGEQCDEKEN